MCTKERKNRTGSQQQRTKQTKKAPPPIVLFYISGTTSSDLRNIHPTTSSRFCNV
eukprot:m.92285 g.92285  ORF g.92285 m.92285 type:complete len:55 (-) comp8887_c0_seq2:2242-2406(-)